MIDDYRYELIECKRRILLDILDVLYQLTKAKVFTDEDLDKNNRIRILTQQKLILMDRINKLAEEEWNND